MIPYFIIEPFPLRNCLCRGPCIKSCIQCCIILFIKSCIQLFAFLKENHCPEQRSQRAEYRHDDAAQLRDEVHDAHETDDPLCDAHTSSNMIHVHIYIHIHMYIILHFHVVFSEAKLKTIICWDLLGWKPEEKCWPRANMKTHTCY